MQDSFNVPRSSSQPPGIRRFQQKKTSNSNNNSAYSTVVVAGINGGKKRRGGISRETAAAFASKRAVSGENKSQAEIKTARKLTVQIIGVKTKKDLWGTHTRYVCEVRKGSHTFRVQRRYRQFLELHQKLGEKYSVDKLKSYDFPPKTMFPDTSTAFQNQRKKALNAYLETLSKDSEIWKSKIVFLFFFPELLPSSSAAPKLKG